MVSTIGNAGMAWQAETNFYFRLAGGYINQAITRRTDLPRQVQQLAHASPAYVSEFEHYVRSAGIGAILLDSNHEPLWEGVLGRIGLKGHATGGGVVVFPVNHCRSCRALSWSQIHHGKPPPVAPA